MLQDRTPGDTRVIDCTLEYVRSDFRFRVTWPNFVGVALLLYLLTSHTLSMEILLRSLIILRDLPRMNVRVGFSLKFKERPAIPRSTILILAMLSMARLAQL